MTRLWVRLTGCMCFVNEARARAAMLFVRPEELRLPPVHRRHILRLPHGVIPRQHLPVVCMTRINYMWVHVYVTRHLQRASSRKYSHSLHARMSFIIRMLILPLFEGYGEYVCIHVPEFACWIRCSSPHYILWVYTHIQWCPHVLWWE